MKPVNPFIYVRAFLRRDRDYLRDNRDGICGANNHMLRLACPIYLAVLLFYTLLVALSGESKTLLYMYYVFDAAHVLLSALVYARTQENQCDFLSTQRYCAVLEINILAFFAAEGVFAFPTQHSLYIPIAILLIIVVFSHGVWYTLSLIVGYLIAFTLMTWLVKPMEAACNDMLVALATLLASLIAYGLLAAMRHRERAAVKRLEYLNTMDVLTGVYNRGAMEALCTAYVERCRGEEARPFALIVMDIDNFKRFNDTYGHAAGDAVLKALAALLRSYFYEKDFVGRFGGDEFVVMMRDDAGSRSNVEAKLRGLLARAEALRFPFGDVRMSISAGAVRGLSGENFQQLFVRADEALYEAKNAGKNQFRISEL